MPQPLKAIAKNTSQKYSKIRTVFSSSKDYGIRCLIGTSPIIYPFQMADYPKSEQQNPSNPYLVVLEIKNNRSRNIYSDPTCNYAVEYSNGSFPSHEFFSTANPFCSFFEVPAHQRSCSSACRSVSQPG